MQVKRGVPVDMHSENSEEKTGGFKSQDPSSILNPSYLKMIRDQVFKDNK